MNHYRAFERNSRSQDRARPAASVRQAARNQTAFTTRRGLPMFLQAKRAVSEPNDPYEQEADRIADRVMRAPEPGLQRACACGGGCPRCQASQRDHGALPLYLAASSPSQARTPVPDSVEQESVTPGGALDADTRSFMERRFGADFSAVRVHHDARAAQSAEEVGARAYTAGTHIVFGAGEYGPHETAGRRLLAHELTHVVQQGGNQALVQRDQKKDAAPQPAAKIDVSIVLSDGEQDMAEGGAYAKTVLRVTDVADAAAKLKALGVPIGKLFVVSHSSSAGEVQFSSSIGTVSWVPIRDLAKALKGSATIDEVDFRGCKLGSAGGAMESFRQTVGAQSTKGSTCWTFIQRVTPLTVGGVDITSPSQIPKVRQAAFDAALLQQLAGLTAANGTPVQNCLVGLAKGENANAKTLAKIWKLYWANNGNLVASWGSPNYNQDWQAGSICSKDMTATTQPCAIVETKAPAVTPPVGGKTSSLDNVRPGVEVGSESAEA